MRKLTAVPCIIGLLAFSVSVHADYSIDWSFDGFGTVGLVYTDEPQADFMGGLFSRRGAGHSRRFSPEVDSRLGFQVTAGFTPSLTGVVQVVSEQNHDGSYTPRVEWANLRYNITPEFDVRVGRMVLPAFLASEYRKVGYANPWVRPPQEVYGLVPVTNLDGIDLSRRFHFDHLTATVRGGYGWTEADIEGGSVKARNAYSLMTTLESPDWTVFARFSRSELVIDVFDPLFDAFRMFGPAGEAVADRFEVDGTKTDIWSLGWRYDPGNWFAMGEFSRSSTRSVLGDSDGWYMTSGYRHGDLTPYLTVAGRHVRSPISDPGLPVAGLPPEQAGTAILLNSILNDILGFAPRQKSLSLGLRWDILPRIALKTQFDYIDLARDSAGLLGNVQPEFKPGGSVSVYSLSIDFVF